MDYVANNPAKRKIKIQEEDGTLRDATPHDLNDAGEKSCRRFSMWKFTPVKPAA